MSSSPSWGRFRNARPPPRSAHSVRHCYRILSACRQMEAPMAPKLARELGLNSPGKPRRSDEALPAPLRNCRDWQSVSISSMCEFRMLLQAQCPGSPPVESFNPAANSSSVAKRKTLFDDRPVEISELTYVIKQDLASLNSQIAGLQALTLAHHPKSTRNKADQEGEHNDNVCGAVANVLSSKLIGQRLWLCCRESSQTWEPTSRKCWKCEQRTSRRHGRAQRTSSRLCRRNRRLH